MVLAASDFRRHGKDVQGPRKRPPAGNTRQRPDALGAPLTWLFLAGLRLRRARLRFTRHNHYRTEGVRENP